MQRPSIKSPCVADHYASRGERIAEVLFPDGSGCLVALRTLADGTNVVEVYREDQGIVVRASAAALRAIAQAEGSTP